MLSILSPAKSLDFENPACVKTFSQPDFLVDSQELIDVLRNFSPEVIRELMGLSEKLANLNMERYRAWDRPFTETNAKQALLAFQGDVYVGLEANTFRARDFTFAQKHLRILSGLYGLLRPLDLIQPYRLEMGTRLATARGKSLYDFWGTRITEALNQSLAAAKCDTLVNLASNEYFKSVKAKQINANVLTPAFKDWKNDQYKMISFFAKKARGMMAGYLVRNRVKTRDDLLAFDGGGYAYNKDLSTEDKPVFTRRVE